MKLSMSEALTVICMHYNEPPSSEVHSQIPSPQGPNGKEAPAPTDAAVQTSAVRSAGVQRILGSSVTSTRGVSKFADS